MLREGGRISALNYRIVGPSQSLSGLGFLRDYSMLLYRIISGSRNRDEYEFGLGFNNEI